MGLLVYVIFAGCVTMSSAVTCYTCHEIAQFDQEEGVFDLTNCSAPSPNNVNTNTNCTGICLTRITLDTMSLDTSSLDTSSLTYYEVSRVCLEGPPLNIRSQCDKGCTTTPSTCRQCCDSDFCNNAPVDDIIKENRMGQTCYECRHSDTPYAGNFNPSCGLTFDPKDTGLRYSFCQGLCYSAVTFIEGVEDVQRGCRSEGEDCDDAINPLLDEGLQMNNLKYDIKCCLGSLCNEGRSLGPAMSMIVLAFFLAL